MTHLGSKHHLLQRIQSKVEEQNDRAPVRIHLGNLQHMVNIQYIIYALDYIPMLLERPWTTYQRWRNGTQCSAENGHNSQSARAARKNLNMRLTGDFKFAFTTVLVAYNSQNAVNLCCESGTDLCARRNKAYQPPGVLHRQYCCNEEGFVTNLARCYDREGLDKCTEEIAVHGWTTNWQKQQQQMRHKWYYKSGDVAIGKVLQSAPVAHSGTCRNKGDAELRDRVQTLGTKARYALIQIEFTNHIITSMDHILNEVLSTSLQNAHKPRVLSDSAN